MRTVIKNACAVAALVSPFAAKFQYNGALICAWLACFAVYAFLSGAYSLKSAYGDDDV